MPLTPDPSPLRSSGAREGAAAVVVRVMDWRVLVRFAEVVAFAGDHMADAAARVRHITNVSRDHVDMHVHDRLAGGCARVEADVVTSRLGLERRVEVLLHFVDQRHERELFFR